MYKIIVKNADVATRAKSTQFYILQNGSNMKAENNILVD